MAGHMVASFLGKLDQYEVFFTSRNGGGIQLNAENFAEVEGLIAGMQPEIVINCIGILNERAAENIVAAIKVNSLLPHMLSKAVSRYGGKVIHISTDCVFSGDKGLYTENDVLDGTSVYAKTKSLGELTEAPHLTIRTSIIGPELKEDGIGLFQWFMKQQGKINGYSNVYWNGVTTLELAKVIDQAIQQNLSGLFHLTSPLPISKHDLLKLIQKYYQKNDVTILPDGKISIDRTLLNTRIDFDYRVPEYPKMISELSKWMSQNE